MKQPFVEDVSPGLDADSLDDFEQALDLRNGRSQEARNSNISEAKMAKVPIDFEIPSYEIAGDKITQEEFFGGEVIVNEDELEKAREFHKKRSSRSKSVDEKHLAPTTNDYDKWKENPNRLDFPTVDTINEETLAERRQQVEEKALEQGVVDEIKKTSQEKTRGKFSPSENSLYGEGDNVVGLQKNLGSRKDFVVPHEIGHAVDYVEDEERDGFVISDEFRRANNKERADKLEGFDDDMQPIFPEEGLETEKIRDELIDVSETVRGRTAGNESYRESEEELFADVFASMAVEPRAARREAPDAVREVEEELFGTGFLPGSPL